MELIGFLPLLPSIIFSLYLSLSRDGRVSQGSDILHANGLYKEVVLVTDSGQFDGSSLLRRGKIGFQVRSS